MRLLIAGWQGQVARCLVAAATRRSDVAACAAGRPALDICELPTIERNLADVAPDVVINTAAYTAVDAAEKEPEAAMALNRDGAAMLARAAAERGVPIIHLSTDYVFDGTKVGPYDESDTPRPINVYGKSKLAGEEAVAAANPAHIIVRTAWIYSPHGRNFVSRMLELAKERDKLHIVDDQRGSPTYAPHLAEAILELAAHIAGRDTEGRAGVYHLAGSGTASWCELARAVFAASKARGGPTAEVAAITSADYPTPATRPMNSRLDCTRIRETFGLQLPHWREGVAACVSELLGAGQTEPGLPPR